MLGAAVQCCSLLLSVLKLLKFQARFPFFVRQVCKKRLECVHVCKVSHPKGEIHVMLRLNITLICYAGPYESYVKA